MAKNESFTLFLMYAYYPLSMLRHYSDFVEKQIAGEVEERESILNSVLKDQDFISVEERKELLENHEYETNRYKEDFVNISRSSSIINIYGFAEKQLVMLCDKHAKNRNEKFIKKKGGNGVTINSKAYLEKAGIDFSILKDQWELLDDIRLIRNCFAHDAGEVDNNDKNLDIAIKRTPGVSINLSNEIQLEKELANRLNNSVGEILDKVYRYTY